MRMLISWLILSFGVWVAAAVLPGFRVKDFRSAIIVAAIFGLLNFFLGWMLFAIFTILTIGLAWLFAFITRWIINALLLALTDRFTTHLTIDRFSTALLAALIISVVAAVTRALIPGFP